MKRRDFFLGATSSAGILLLGSANAARPCAPVLAGASGASPCEQSDAEADWQSRIAGPGVVWHHDFRTDAEVDAFRWAGGYGNDPNDTQRPGLCVRNTTDGVTGGGCLELIYGVGNRTAPGWWRPFSPMSAASNGRGQDDPAASGSIALEPWDPSFRGENEGFRRGYYAHPSYIGAGGFDTSQFNGSEFWLQFRIKIDPNRYLSGTPRQGKQSFLATTQQTLNQEIVQQNEHDGVALWYTNFGSSPDTGGSMGLPNGVNGKQPGGDYASCSLDTTNGCWVYTGGEWVTWLYHLVPGTDGDRNTLFEAFVARPGQRSYETVFSHQNTINFSATTTGHPQGYNSFQPSNYMNGQTTTVAWYQRYDQIVLSHDRIACPQF